MTEPRGLSDEKRTDPIVTSPPAPGGLKAYDLFSFIEMAVELICWFSMEVIVPLLSLLV